MIGERLRQERERLGLTQPAFADAAGAAKRTLIDWEKGVSSPTAVQLGALAAVGADVLYIVTGQRSQVLPPAATLPRDQRALLNSYEMCSEPARKTLLQTAALLAAGMPPGGAPPSASGISQTNRGHGAVQIGHVGAPRRKT
jgi:transcriptional regulator with XRE-family HTH domain